jgi:hypothetical protein
MSIDQNWEMARTDILELLAKISSHIENPKEYMPGNLDEVVTPDEFEESKKWEAKLQEMLCDLNINKDELFFTEHLRKQDALTSFADAMIELKKPVGFNQGVSR